MKPTVERLMRAMALGDATAAAELGRQLAEYRADGLMRPPHTIQVKAWNGDIVRRPAPPPTVNVPCEDHEERRWSTIGVEPACQSCEGTGVLVLCDPEQGGCGGYRNDGVTGPARCGCVD